MATHTMHLRDAAELLRTLAAHGVDVAVGGGWGVDALVGEQTREHSDLDLWLKPKRLRACFVRSVDTESTGSCRGRATDPGISSSTTVRRDVSTSTSMRR